jgi:hypothetical protein
MKNTLLLLFCIVCSTLSFGQALDFEQTGFEIKAVAIKKQKSALAYHVAKKELPSKLVLGPVLKEKKVDFYASQEQQVFNAKQNSNPNVQISPLKGKEVFSFGEDGAINGVKNIAYKPAIAGNIHHAYCTALAASRSGN